jgi:leucyl-tRNA synthetase
MTDITSIPSTASTVSCASTATTVSITHQSNMKTTTLKGIEDRVKSKVNTIQSEINYTKPKFFATFPIPYSNGLMHLGHAFTSTKVDFEVRQKHIKGYNVLYPFSFHVSGIPIHSASINLDKEIKSGIKGKQYEIMKSMNIPEEEIPKFTDPKEWVRYFPMIGMKDIKKLGLMIDDRRSFVTTDINPFFDKFVQWQFTKLSEKYLKYGTRCSIFSPKLDMQCQDHDRSIGEGIKNVNFKIYKISYDDSYIFIPYEDNFNVKNPVSVNIKQKQKYSKYNIEGFDKCVIMTDYIYKNYSAQFPENIELIQSDIVLENLENLENSPNVNFVNKYTSKYAEFIGGEVNCIDHVNDYTINNDEKIISLTSDIVIDRVGEICIVKPVEQYYIDYANPEWKAQAYNAIENMILPNDIKKNLKENLEWLKEHGVSRTFGLGTKMPNDSKFIIDSLSDSTIYPAYYTFAHLIQEDMYGKSIYDPNDFTVEVFDYIFYGKWSESIKIDRIKLDEMRANFEYFYPVDIRISGKDLIKNHLVMYIMNHCAIFDKKYYPVSINCNGYIMVNKEKMSKSNGNFITIDSELKKYSVDTVRFTLAESGDGIDDANYDCKKTETNTLKLYTFVNSIEKFVDENTTYNSDVSEIDIIFKNMFLKIFNNVIESYDKKEYMLVTTNAFHIINNLKESYRITSKYFGRKPNIEIITDVIKRQIMYLYPIIPHISTYLADIMKFEMYDDSTKFIVDEGIINRYHDIEKLIDNIKVKYEKFVKRKIIYNKCIISGQCSEFEKIIIRNKFKFNIEFTDENTDKFYIIFAN